ncbi:terminase [Amycolatopsis sp. H20-H5]|uniref:terminase n=1 Tax=Amycolatopsis sp. H20-H5 TaxID=3046309 RepID=UPI002DB99860|nr:terminase [Amycolatopsis sp. H20-H5]MEC3975094.1 terminase [Amycolatopsis sp. H20-H5]
MQAVASSRRSAPPAEPKPCRLKICTDPQEAYGFCSAHFRQRRPAEWATRRAQRRSTTRPSAGRPASKPLIGRTQARLFTKPLRRLTRTSTRGYEVIDFARDVLGEPLLPWQEWLVIHALELLADNTFRFRTVISLVARQNGKTHLSKVLALWRLYVDGARLVLGAAQDLSIAQEVLELANDTIDEVPELAAEKLAYIRANGKEALKLTTGGRYLIRASNRKAGRGLTVDHLTMDELREQRNWAAWGALSKTTMARARGQIWCLSNAGDDQSVVLNHLRAAAGVELVDGVDVMGEARDPSIGLFEWSAPLGCEIDDEDAWAQANPSLGHTMGVAAIRSAMGTDPVEVFRTEVLCQKVDQLNSAVDLVAWAACKDPLGTMDDLRERIMLCLDVAPDGQHVTVVAAAETPDGRVRVEPVAAWKSTEDARIELPALIARIAPAALAWFPAGPAAALAAELRPPESKTTERRARSTGPQYVELTGAAVAEACQGFADLVAARRVLQPGDPLLDAHIAGAQKYGVGDGGWRFVRRGAGHVDAAYAAAGAVHVVRTLPVVVAPKPMIVRARRRSPAGG